MHETLRGNCEPVRDRASVLDISRRRAAQAHSRFYTGRHRDLQQLRQAAGVQATHHPRTVELHRAWADPERLADRLVGPVLLALALGLQFSGYMPVGLCVLHDPKRDPGVSREAEAAERSADELVLTCPPRSVPPVMRDRREHGGDWDGEAAQA